MSSTVIVQADHGPFLDFLVEHDFEPGPGDRIVAGVLYQRAGSIADALIVYFHPALGVVFSFLSTTPRPFMALTRCVLTVEKWLPRIGVFRYSFVVDEHMKAYRSIIERWGAVEVGRRGADVLYVRHLAPAAAPPKPSRRGRRRGLRSGREGDQDRAVAGA